MAAFTAHVYITDAQDNEFEIECHVYGGDAGDRDNPPDPGEVEVVSVRLNGDKVNGKAVDDLVEANLDCIEEQAWDYFMEAQDDYEEPDYPEYDDFDRYGDDY